MENFIYKKNKLTSYHNCLRTTQVQNYIYRVKTSGLYYFVLRHGRVCR